jgi:cell division transport system permease protein
VRSARISFILRRAVQSLKELLWTHILTSATMAMTLFILGGFLLVQVNLQSMLKGWGSQIQIFAYLDNQLAVRDRDTLLTSIRAYPEVESVRFVSREQAWESFKKSMGSQSSLLEGLQPDILPSSLEIVLKMAYRNRDSVSDVAKRLRGLGGINEVEYPEAWLERFSLIILGVQWVQWIFGGFLFVATLLIVGNTVKLAILGRKDEIEIMQLVGASPGLIQAPFVIEGMIQGIMGASFALLLLWLLFMFLSAQLPSFLGVSLFHDRVHFLNGRGMALLLLLGWLLGTCGSFLSLRKFFRA